MLRLLFLAIFFSLSLHALSNSAILKRADDFIRSHNKTNQFRAYNDYKNLYLRAIISDNQSLRKSSLRGIVLSGKKLHIDVSQYKQELDALSHKKIKHTQKRKKKKVLKLSSTNNLKSIGFENSKLILRFKNRLNNKDINYFSVYDSSKKEYRYVFDIHSSMGKYSKRLKKYGIKSIKLSYYNSNTIRLLIKNNSRLVLRFKKTNKQLVINIQTGKKSSHHTVSKVVKRVLTPKRGDRSKIIVIDAGHGGKDPGALGYKGYREKNVVIKIAKNVRKILTNRGYKVYMTRDDDRFIKLRDRTGLANKKHANLFISIHANASSNLKARGIECYFLARSRSKRASRVAAKENSADISAMNRYSKRNFLNFLNHYKILASNKLAIDLQRGILGTLKNNYRHIKDGGVREGPFWVLVGAQMPAVLIEVGFISNKSEAKRLVNSEYQKKISLGIANGVERYFANN